MKKNLLVVLLAALASSQASAGELYDGFAVYGAAGTGGLGIGISKALTEDFGVRADVMKYDHNVTSTKGSMQYDGKLRLRDAGVYGDWRPFSGNFRLVGGVTVSSSNGDFSATGSGGTYTFNGVTTTAAAGEYVKGKVEFPSVMPYVGVGWGFGNYNKPGLTFGLDIGVAIGKAKGSLDVSSGLVAAVGADNVAAETQKFKDSVEKLSFLPVVKMGFGWAF